MGQQLASDEITFATHHDDSSFYATVKRVTIILSIVTIVELGLGLLIYKMGEGSALAILLIKGIITILSLAKAFYITSYFMHLGDEIRNFIMTIVVPLLLFVWFIAAFLIDGASWRNLKNTQAGSKPAQTEQVSPAPVAIPEGAEK
jgi:cytochrome c oxidase subunit IV